MTVVVREPVTTLVVRDPQLLIVTEPAERIVVRETVHEVVVVREPGALTIHEGVGPRGIPGTNRLFIQPDQPLDVPPVYAWFQTGLGVDGSGFTLWLEDGQP